MISLDIKIPHLKIAPLVGNLEVGNLEGILLVDAQSMFWRWNVIKICVWTCVMTSRSYFGKMNSTLGSVVPLAMFENTYSSICLPIQWTYPQPTPKRQGDASNRHITPQLLAEYVQYQCISSSDRYSSVFAVCPIQIYLWYRGPNCRGSICHTNIFQRPNLPNNDTLGPKKCGAQFTTKLARVLICQKMAP